MLVDVKDHVKRYIFEGRRVGLNIYAIRTLPGTGNADGGLVSGASKARQETWECPSICYGKLLFWTVRVRVVALR